MAALGISCERVTDIHDVRARIVAGLTDQQAPASPFSTSHVHPGYTGLAPAVHRDSGLRKVIAPITSLDRGRTAILARGGPARYSAAKGVINSC